jgi:hypothetical protein
MLRIGRVAAAGLAGWAARLLYAAGFAAGAVGLFIALFHSLGQRSPGHDWMLGFNVMVGGFVVSVLGYIGAFIPGFNRRLSRRDPNGRSAWYVCPYLVFLSTAVALLCLSCALRLIGDWERSNVTVTATLSDCSTQTSDSSTSYGCTYDWDWNGVHHTQGRPADAQYPDGQLSGLWIDPVTGGADEHSYGDIVFAFIGAGLLGGVDLAVYLFLTVGAFDSRDKLGRWLDDLAWWRELPPREPEPAASTAPAAPVIEDAIPAIGAEPAWVEDARPPGY